MSILGPFKSVAMNKHFVRNNLVDRDKELRRRVNAGFLHNTTVSQLSEMTDDMGILIKGMIISPASTATDLEPTSTGFSGTVLVGDGITIGSTLYSLADILAGVVQVGIIPGGGLVAGAGAVTIDSDGINIAGGVNDWNKIEFFDGATAIAVLSANSVGTTAAALSVFPTDSSDSTLIELISTVTNGGSGTAVSELEATKGLTQALVSVDTTSGIVLHTTVGTIDINSAGIDIDTKIRGLTDDNLIYADAGNNRVGIGTATPATKLQVEGAVTLLESAAPSTPAAGYGAIYETTDNILRFKDDAGVAYPLSMPRYITIRVIANATDWSADGTLAVGGTWVCPFAGTIVDIEADVDTAGTTGTAIVDVNLNGTTIMTTNKLKWDSTETSTRTYSGTAPGLTTTAVAVGDKFTVDLDTNHTTKSKGLTIFFAIRET